MKPTRWSNKELSMLFDRLGMFLSAGMPLNKAIDSSAYGFRAKKCKTLSSVRDGVLQGFSLCKSMSVIVLPTTVHGLLETGELTGNLSGSLRECKALIDRQEDLKNSLFTALLYPVVIAFFAGILTLGLMIGIMPQITPMLIGLHIDLPFLTKIVIFISQSIVNYGLAMLLLGLVLSSLGYFAYKKVYVISRIAYIVFSKIPIVGKIISDNSAVLFLGSFGRLLESGMSIGAAYERSCDIVPFIPVREKLLRKAESIRQGRAVAQCIDADSVPSFVLPLIDAGELCGTLGDSLVRSANIIQDDLSRNLKRLTALLEPAMMVAMGVTIGAIALSIMLPIYDISKTLQR